MKNTKRISVVFLVCIIVMCAFTACHSHKAGDEWKIDKDSHWRECDCGEITEKGEHTFDLDICTVCSAERKTQDGSITELAVYNSYGDWIQCLYFDEKGEYAGVDSAEYTYDEKGNMLTEKIYEDGVLFLSSDFEYGSDGYTYRKYETEHYADGGKCVCELNEAGDELGYILYDEQGNQLESFRSEYVTDENGELTGEKVYENDVLVREMKYASAKNEEEEYYYITEEKVYAEDGSSLVKKYSEDGDVIQELSYNAEGEKEYTYDLEYFYDGEGNLVRVEKKEDGVVKAEIISEYDSEDNLKAELTYEGDKLVEQAIYTAAENFSYVSKRIIYNEDGTETVYEYDENGNITE